RRRDSQGADGAGRLVVEDRLPDEAVVGTLPDAAVVDADVKDVGLARHAGGADGPAAAEGADHPPAQAVLERRAERLRAGGWDEEGAGGNEEQADEHDGPPGGSRRANKLPAPRRGGNRNRASLRSLSWWDSPQRLSRILLRPGAGNIRKRDPR